MAEPKKQALDSVVTPEFRLSFPHLYDPEDKNGRVRYSLSMIFPPTADLGPLKVAIRAAVLAKFPPPAAIPKGMKNPIRSGDEVDWDGYAGNMFASARNQDQPGLVDERCQQIVDRKKLYAGCWCRAFVQAYWYDKEGGKGVALSLKHVQFIRDDQPFTSRVKAEDVFTAVEGPAIVPAGDEFFS